MSHIPDDKLFASGHRVRGKVVVITGAANGIGKETATRFGSYGAKVVIGDLDTAGAEITVKDIEAAGGQATSIRCNVTSWDDQVALFELAIQKYGQVDIVIPNAGVSEIGSFESVKFADGKPVKPNTKTLEVNLTGTLYSAHLALHYLNIKKQRDDLKALVLIGSMASWAAIPRGGMYSASKHAVLGLMRSLTPGFELKNMRIACIHPFFADTAIVPKPVKLLLAGIPLAPVPRIAGAVFFAATDSDPATSGASYLLTDDGPVFMCPKEEFKMGVFGMIDRRANFALSSIKSGLYYYRLVRDVWKILGRPVVTTAVVGAAAKYAWDYKDVISQQVQQVIGK